MLSGDHNQFHLTKILIVLSLYHDTALISWIFSNKWR